MIPIAYDKKQMMHIEITDDSNGAKYTGEYIDMRIDRATIPDDKIAYDCRHDDNGDWVTPVTIEGRHVWVNFAGTFITDIPIIFPNRFDPYIPITVENLF